MEKFFKWLYYAGLSLLVAFTLYMVSVMYFAPRKDALERGFIPCTKDLVFNISACERGEIGCPLKNLWTDMQCNVEVVTSGFILWLKGEQPAPWSNYIYEPMTMPEVADATMSNEDAYINMEELKQKYEQKIKQQGLDSGEVKLLPEGVEVADTIAEQVPEDVKSTKQEYEEHPSVGNIDEEADFAENKHKNKGEDKNEK